MLKQLQVEISQEPLKNYDSTYDPQDIQDLVLGFQNMGGKLNEAEKEYHFNARTNKCRYKVDRRTNRNRKTPETLEQINERLKKAGADNQNNILLSL